MYNIYNMPLSNNEKVRNAQTKALNNQPLGMLDKIVLGRDNIVREIDGYTLKPDCVYRAVSQELLELYQQCGYIVGVDKDDEYVEYEENGQRYNNNRGVDWYLGGAAPRYGDVIIECPADERFFTPAMDYGSGMALDPMVRLMKSSGAKNPVPTDMITNVLYIQKELEQSSAKHR